MPVKSVGNKRVVDAGSIVLGRADTQVLFELADLSIEVRFEHVPQTGEPQTIAKQTGPKSLQITLVNWENNLGTAVLQPVGTFEGNKLSLHLYGSIIGEPGSEFIRVIHYSFLAGGAQ